MKCNRRHFPIDYIKSRWVDDVHAGAYTGVAIM